MTFHADRGAQSTPAVFAQVCDGFKIGRSMGRVGSSYDNVLAVSFWQDLKRETMHQRLFSTMCQVRLEIFPWLTYYNARRHRSALNHLSPAEFEQQHQSERRLTPGAGNPCPCSGATSPVPKPT
ncbi:integrase core domain-containing protein [Streptomyces celluloflavus]